MSDPVESMGDKIIRLRNLWQLEVDLKAAVSHVKLLPEYNLQGSWLVKFHVYIEGQIRNLESEVFISGNF